jgi:hypothetical protein
VEHGVKVLGPIISMAQAGPSSESGRTFCRSCGTLIPGEAKYCPLCGAVQQPEALVPGITKPVGGAARHVIGRIRRIRLYLILVSLAAFLVVFFVGSAIPLNLQEADAIVREFNRAIGTTPTVAQIFRNNLTLCLLFFIPGFGTLFMIFVAYNTGVVLSAYALIYPSSPNALYLALLTLAFPWTWMEFAAYSLASGEGLMIIVSLVRRNLRKEARTALIVLGVTVALLALGAIIETLAIGSLS